MALDGFEFETEHGNRVVVDRVEGRLRVCYYTVDGDDFDVIMFDAENEGKLQRMVK